jgi:uncharacterized protein (TIGR00661 family)
MFNSISKKRILVAPLNWGLGHATRCIPIINALIDNNFEPIIASDGVALELLKKEFPNLTHLELPSYQIEYPKNGKFFKLKMLALSPKIIQAIISERYNVNKICSTHSIDGIISDNRLGVRNKKVPSVFITHQLNVLTGNTSWLSTKAHLKVVKKYQECWVPDFKGSFNLSGKLGHLNNLPENVKYIGPLSRFEKKEILPKYNLMVILSGPEPQRTLLEEKLISELQNYPEKILFVKGKIESQQTIEEKDQFIFYNYMNSTELENAFNESKNILCRSGYTTVMDLAKLGKKAFFIPTPGQYEQEYLAHKFKQDGIAPTCIQEKFKVAKLNKLDLYKGFKHTFAEANWSDLFKLFK